MAKSAEGVHSFSDLLTALFYSHGSQLLFSDRARIKMLIELYEYYKCLWNVYLPKYKTLTRKKLAKTEIGKHFGWSGNNNFRSMLFVVSFQASWSADDVGRQNVGSQCMWLKVVIIHCIHSSPVNYVN